MSFKAKDPSNPRFNWGLPKVDSSIGMPGSTAKGSTCNGHQMTRTLSPAESASLTVLRDSFASGVTINQSTVDDLRNKIKVELERRLAHYTYNSGTTGSRITALKNSLLNSIVQGTTTATAIGVNNNDALQEIGQSSSPSNILRGAVPDDELVVSGVGIDATKDTVYPATNQLNLSSNPYNIDPDYPNPPTYPNTGMHSPPYTQQRDRKSVYPTYVSFYQGKKMLGLDYQRLVLNYRALYRDCVCHSDCNCNAVCACHNNCGCNY